MRAARSLEKLEVKPRKIYAGQKMERGLHRACQCVSSGRIDELASLLEFVILVDIDLQAK